MTERSVSVRLIAITSQYDQAMKNSGKATTDLGTQAELAGVKASGAGGDFDNLGRRIGDADNAARRAKPSFSALGISIAAIGPALIPIGAAAIGAAGAFAGMGAAGILAFKGIENEMKAATPLGLAYSAAVNELKGNLASLEHTAAAGMLTSFDAAVADIQTLMPALNDDIAKFSDALGKIGGNVLTGTIVAFHTLQPLVTDIAAGFEDLSAKFAAWATNSGGLQKWADYAQAVLPQVEQTLSILAQAVGDLVSAIAPLGLESLSAIGLLSHAINAIPVDVLKVLVPLIANAYLAFKAYQGLSVAVNALGALSARLAAVTVATGESATAARAASVAYRGLEAAAGPIGIALAAAGTLMAYFGNNTEKSKQQVDDFKNALIQSKGAIDDNVLSMTALKLQDGGFADSAAKAGVSLHDLTAAVTGTDTQFSAMLKTLHDSGDVSTLTLAKLVQLRDQFDKGQISAKQLAEALPAVADGMTSTASAAQTATDAADAFTKALQGISTAAGGDVIRSQDALQKQLNAVADALHASKGAFDQYSSAGLNSRDAIDQAATSAQSYAAQVFKQTGSVQAAEEAYQGWYQALVQTAQAQGISKNALDTYLASVGQLPGQVDKALATMTTVGGNASANLVNGAVSGITSNAGALSSIGTYTGTTVGSAAQAQMAQAGTASGAAFVNNLIALVDQGLRNVSAVVKADAEAFALSMQGSTVSATAAEHEQATGFAGGPAAPVISFPTPLRVGGTSPTIKAGGLTPVKAGGGSGKTAAQTAHDKVVAADDLLAAQALAAIAPTNKLALAQEAVADATRRLNNETTKGSLEYYQDLTKLHQAQADLNAEIKAEAQARADAAKKLADDIASEQALYAKEAQTQAQYYADLNNLAADHAAKDKALMDQRQADIEGFAAADQKAQVSFGSSLSFLTSNVEDQAGQITQWMTLLQQARDKGVSEAVIEALGLDKGPQAIGQLKQFSTATQDQIDALNKAVSDKNKAAGQEVTVEAQNNYGALGQALLSEQQSYADAVTALQQKFIADMAELAKEAQDLQTTIAGDQGTLNAIPPQYQQVGTAGHVTATPGTALYLKEPDGSYYHLSPAQLAAQAAGTPIYEKLYDAGGVLPPGRTVAYNATGRNEFILTHDQISSIVGGTLGGVNVRVFIGDRELTDIVDVEISRVNAGKRRAILVGGVR